MTLPPVAALFVELAEIVSAPGRERRLADRVRAEVLRFGAEPVEDDAAAALGDGADTGNILVRIPPHGDGAGEPLLFCAHMDTIDPGPTVRVVCDDGTLRAAEGAVLGADNKAAVAAMLDGVRRVIEDGTPHGGIELLFTPQEEVGLRGALLFDASVLRARTGYLYDVPGELGGVVMSAPSHRRVELAFTGRPAHASRPDEGANAIVAAATAVAAFPHGRVYPRTTVNVGTICGGTVVNVVAAHATVVLEIRSHDDARGRAVTDEILAGARTAAKAHGCTVAADVSTSYASYRHDPHSRPVEVAELALRRVGTAPYRVEPHGGSDANVLNAAGLTCVNIAPGMEAIHSPDEHITVADLQRLSDLTVALVEIGGNRR